MSTNENLLNSLTEKDGIVRLYMYEVVEFSWGSGVKEIRTNKWVRVFISPDAQELNVEDINIELHENGIEFK
jgi:hypothetical protein